MKLVLLQNAWARRAMSSWPHGSWVAALARSRSGRRLAKLLGEDCFGSGLVHFGNTTPRVGQGPDSRLPPDDLHVISLLDGIEVVVACGRQAEEAARRLWKGPLLCLPHPACRVLTNDLLAEGHRLLFTAGPLRRRVALRQLRGSVATVELED